MALYDNAINSYKDQLEKLLNSVLYKFDSVDRTQIPKSAGLYIISTKNNDCLYIGKSKDLRRRLISDHLKGDRTGSAFRHNLLDMLKISSENKATAYIQDNCYFKYMAVNNPSNLEHFAIAVLTPKLNR